MSEHMYDLDRRRFLGLCLGAASASVAGCSTSGTGTDGPYAEWLPASDGGSVFASIDFTLDAETARINPVLPLVLPAEGGGDDDTLAPALSLDDVEDPLLTFPLETGGRVLGGAVLSLAVVGLGDLVDPARPATGVTEVVFADGTSVGRGDLDPGDIADRLRSGPEVARFERVGEQGGFTFYGLVSGDDGFAAVGDDAVVVADSRRDVEGVLETRRGTREDAASADDTVASLLDATDPGHVAVGWEGPVDLDQFTVGDGDVDTGAAFVSTADDVVASVAFDPDEGDLSAELALDAADGVDADRLETRLGDASADHSLSVDGDRVTASATYREETVDLDFVATEPTAAPTVPRETDLPPGVAAAVPDDPFDFTFLSDEEAVRVEFAAGLEVDSVSITAVPSGRESTSSTPDSIKSLYVYPESADDIVVVRVTVDGVSAVVDRYELP